MPAWTGYPGGFEAWKAANLPIIQLENEAQRRASVARAEAAAKLRRERARLAQELINQQR